MSSEQSQLPPEKILLVEGNNDHHVIGHITCKSSIESSFEIVSKNSVENLLEAISVEMKVSGRKVVGIVVDANSNLKRRWDSVIKKLCEFDLDLPLNPKPSGTIIDGEPRIGIWLMPDNRNIGELEDFVQKMIPIEDPLWPKAQRYITDIPQHERKFRENKISRAQLYAWLATRERPSPMGLAIKKGDLLISGEPQLKFIDWLRDLFCAST